MLGSSESELEIFAIRQSHTDLLVLVSLSIPNKIKKGSDQL